MFLRKTFSVFCKSLVGLGKPNCAGDGLTILFLSATMFTARLSILSSSGTIFSHSSEFLLNMSVLIQCIFLLSVGSTLNSLFTFLAGLSYTFVLYLFGTVHGIITDLTILYFLLRCSEAKYIGECSSSSVRGAGEDEDSSQKYDSIYSPYSGC